MDEVETYGITHFEVAEVGHRYQVRVEYRPNDQRGEIGVRFYRLVDGQWLPRKSGIHFAASRLPTVLGAMLAMQRHVRGADGR